MPDKVYRRKLTDLVPDGKNANAGTERGLRLLDDSLTEDGAGRGILLDKNNNVIAGNKTLERAVDQGFTEIIVVPTDGRQLVATQRIDVDLDTPQGRRMAIRDNRVAEIDLSWDADALRAIQDDGVDLAQFFNDGELAKVLNQGEELDYSQVWQGMPEFDQDNLGAFRSIIVHFADDSAIKDFEQLIGQSLPEKAKWIWHPKRVIEPYGEVHES